MLVNHANALGNGISGRRDLNRFAAKKELPFVGLVETKEHFHERALARTIFAQQRVHYIKIDAVVSEHAGEPFSNAAHF